MRRRGRCILFPSQSPTSIGKRQLKATGQQHKRHLRRCPLSSCRLLRHGCRRRHRSLARSHKRNRACVQANRPLLRPSRLCKKRQSNDPLPLRKLSVTTKAASSAVSSTSDPHRTTFRILHALIAVWGSIRCASLWSCNFWRLFVILSSDCRCLLVENVLLCAHLAAEKQGQRRDGDEGGRHELVTATTVLGVALPFVRAVSLRLRTHHSVTFATGCQRVEDSMGVLQTW